MIKEYNKEPRSQASGPVLLKEILKNCNLPLNKVNVPVKRSYKILYTNEEKERLREELIKEGKKGCRILRATFNDIEEDHERSIGLQVHLLGPKEKIILRSFLGFKSTDGKSRQYRESIAKKAKCSKRHISRTTKKFQELGWLSKERDTGWERVQYKINPLLVSGPLSSEFWLNLLNEEELQVYIDHDMLPGGYIPKSIPKERIIPRATYWKKREEEIKKFKEEKRKVEEQKNRKERENYRSPSNRVEVTPSKEIYISGSYLSKNLQGCENVDKYFVSGRSKYPVSRDVEMSKKTLNFNNLGFSRVMTHISSLYEFNASQRLKLFAFPISCLEIVFENMESYVSPQRGGRKFFLKCQAHCEQRRMKPDWNRYTSLCEEYGITKDIVSSSNSKSGMYNIHVSQKKETLEYLIEQRLSWKQRIHEAEGKPDPLCMIGVTRSRLAMVEEEIAQRIDNGETIH